MHIDTVYNLFIFKDQIQVWKFDIIKIQDQLKDRHFLLMYQWSSLTRLHSCATVQAACSTK
jgi:hypothetical protein